jgi:ribosomal protein S18 acetylase RimI-like enzyme
MPMTMGQTILKMTSSDDVDAVRVLFREYAGSQGIDLYLRNFEQELTQLPGEYAPPGGCLLLATAGAEPVGCVALRKLHDDVCEMKRLYVRRQFRGLGLGRRLVEQVTREARHVGYQAIRLDTIQTVMESAIALYRSLGFREIPAYCFNPIPGAVFMELPLRIMVWEEAQADLGSTRPL